MTISGDLVNTFHSNSTIHIYSNDGLIFAIIQEFINTLTTSFS